MAEGRARSDMTPGPVKRGALLYFVYLNRITNTLTRQINCHVYQKVCNLNRLGSRPLNRLGL